MSNNKAKVEYQVDPIIPQGPQSGHLFVVTPHRRDNYHANSVRKSYDTGVTIAVPAGVTVEIDGIYEQEAMGLYVTPQRLHGPLPPQRIFLNVWNRANATLPLEVDNPMATIRAITTPPLRPWEEHTPESPQQREQALMGERDRVAQGA